MSEWGRLQDSLHDHFDEQGVTGVDVDKLIEHLVNVRDFFPGLLTRTPPSVPPAAPLDPNRPMPFVQRVSPPFTNRAQELAQAFREAVAQAHEHGTHVEWMGKPLHPLVEDDDYNCPNAWCQRMWAMVREAEDAARLVPPAAPLDVPPEAIEWARELVRQGYRDEHIVTFTEDGYGLEHPIRCRPNLTGCVLNEWLRTQMAPDREPGRYVMEWRDDGPEYARLAQQDGTED